MKRQKWMIVLVLIALVTLILSTVSYSVDQTRDLVVITTFGKFTKVIDGRIEGQAGLHFKWPYPIQSLTRYDSRAHILRSPHAQCTTRQQHPFVITATCRWKITNAQKFYASKKTYAQAVSSLRSHLQSEVSSVISNSDSESLVTTVEGRMKLKEIGQQIAQRMNFGTSDSEEPNKAKDAKEIKRGTIEQYGVTITHAGITAQVVSEAAADVVAESMIKDRQREVARFNAEGAAVAIAIIGRAKAAESMIRETSKRVASEIRTSGEAEAAKEYAKLAAHPKFAMFLRSIESMRTILKANTVFLLDGSKLPTLRFLRETPTLDIYETTAKPATSAK
ncbi:MAG: hypothetical protein HN370_00190 [Phycisphaerales bacterium]|jgi:modulator of FtsH protease HflC|nr:hypothetical protein [Phycisphaerales bacterium]